jgi:hypothetical protein
MRSALKPGRREQQTLLQRLDTPGFNLVRAANRLKRNPGMIGAAISAIGSDKTRAKFADSKLLRILSEESPELVYPRFDFLADC